MESKDYWKLFETSGSVKDYMNFKTDENDEPCADGKEKSGATNNNGACAEGNKDRRE